MFLLSDPLYFFYQSYAYQLKKLSILSEDWISHHAYEQENLQELLSDFKQEIWNYYTKNRRDFAWRNTTDPYAILVSEIMLQQTQTQRVKEKYKEFLCKFPTFQMLACASKQELLSCWVGLGYNRRALALQEIAQWVVSEQRGKLPDDPVLLESCRGLGPATAASIVTFAFNKPLVFIETNIRAVYLHIFFNNQEEITDKLLFPLVAATVDIYNPKEWYYALMDYGVFVKKNYKNPNRKSKHYIKQSKFVGSDRQIRGAIIRLLAKNKKLALAALTQEILQELTQKIAKKIRHEIKHVEQAALLEQVRFGAIIAQLQKDGFLVIQEDFCMLQE